MSTRSLVTALLLLSLTGLVAAPVAAQIPGGQSKPLSADEEAARKKADDAEERFCSTPINQGSLTCLNREKTLYNACLSKHQASPSEGDIVFAEQWCSYVSDFAAYMARELLPITREAYAAATKPQLDLAFKGLQIGGEFKFSDMPNEQGDGATIKGVVNREIENGSRYGICAKKECGMGRDQQRARWKCSPAPLPTAFLLCEIDTPGKFATAFGAKLDEVKIELVAPSYLNFLSLGDAGSIPWRIAAIHLTSKDASMLEAAKNYLQAATKTQSKAQQSKGRPLDTGGLTPSKERCVAVMKKRIANLTSADIELKKQCNNPLTTLAQTEVEQKSFEYGDCCAVKRSESGIVSYVTMSLTSAEYSKVVNSAQAKKIVEAAREEYAAKESARKSKDF